MNKRIKITLAGAALLCVLVTGLCGCAAEPYRSAYDVATELGYDGSEASWMASQSGGSTEMRRIYEEAKRDGYTGSYIQFLKELGFGSSDDSLGVNRGLMSTVRVSANFRYPLASGGDAYASGGAGVLYSVDRAEGDAYVITNYHVVYSPKSAGREKIAHMSDDIDVYLYGETGDAAAISATFVGGAMDYDIAVLRIEDSAILKASDVFGATAADSDALTVGERVYAVGNPGLSGISAVSGIVSVVAENIPVYRADNSGTISLLEIRTDAPINHGNSGGGLYNADGKLVGIVNARSEASGVEHFGYAIPANLALAVAQNVIDNSGSNASRGALRATLGITTQREGSARAVYDEETGKAYLVEDIRIVDVRLGSIAYGKLYEGDILCSVQINDGVKVPAKYITRDYMLTVMMFNVRKGDDLHIVVSRGSKTVTVDFTFDNDNDFTLFD